MLLENHSNFMKTAIITTTACVVLTITAQNASAWGCVRGGGARAVNRTVTVYNNSAYGYYNYGGCYGAGNVAGGGPAALVGGPESNPDYVPIPTKAPAPTNVDPLDQGIQDGPYSPGLYGRPAEDSGTPLK